jgi:hypothetical protein
MKAVNSVWHRWWAAPVGLVVLGGAALAAGMLVYIGDREAGRTMLLPSMAALHGGPFFGPLGQWLPSLAHVLAFSLFSAALLARQPAWERGACAFWFVVNAAFEIGQHPQVRGPLVDALEHAFGPGAFARALENYFTRGTFDVGDLVAAAIGATLAAGILQRLRAHRENPYAP